MVVAKALQVVLLVEGGPLQIGKHVRDLVHVLNQAKAVLRSWEIKLVFYTYSM